MSADWEVALDRQLASWLFYASERGQGYLGSYSSSVVRKYGEQEWAETLVRAIPSVLWQADPIYVTPEMMSLLEASWPSYEPEPLRAEDLLVPAGFVWLPRPVQTIDIQGKRMAHRAFAWAQALGHRGSDSKPGIVLFSFAAPDDPDEYKEEIVAERGGDYITEYREFFGQAVALGHMTTVWYGEDWIQGERDAIDFAMDVDGEPIEIDPVKAVAANLSIAQLVGAMWRLLNQQIAVGMRQRPARAARHRSERAGYDEKYVTVVTLRRPKGHTGEHREVDWSHRWIVSGHWRWQPYKDGTHRQIWIAPFVKGPDDKPLVVRGARVFRWAR